MVWRCPNGAARPKAHGHRGGEDFFPAGHALVGADGPNEAGKRDIFFPLPLHAAGTEQKQAAPSRLARLRVMEQVVIAPPEIVDAIDAAISKRLRPGWQRAATQMLRLTASRLIASRVAAR